jgi:hypothetical protein
MPEAFRKDRSLSQCEAPPQTSTLLLSATGSATEEKIMNFMSNAFLETESAHRALRIRSEYGTKRHHPFRAVGRAIVRTHKRIEGV